MKGDSDLTRLVILLVGVTAALLMVYFAALGPVVWLGHQGWIDASPDSVAASIYWPVTEVANYEPFKTAFLFYVRLWVPEP
jgi:hypothetical protein